jgi:HSP20 family protein
MKYLSPFSSRYGIAPYSSGSSLGSLEKEFEKLFGSLPSLFDVGGEWFAESDARSLNTRWYEHDDAYVARIELPGVESKDVALEVGENALSLTAKRVAKAKEGESEASISYSESLSVPEGVDADKATAEFKDGILSVSFPKTALVKPRRIDVS